MKLDRRIFWDVDYSNIDFEKNANWVIVRVFERGDVEDIRAVRRYYGEDKVKEALLNAKHLLSTRLHLAAAVIGEPIEKFRCYNPQPSNPKHTPY
jgi:hypothetical protein